MAEKKYALDFDFGEWEKYITKSLGEPKFRAGQICGWLWQKRVCDPAEMTNLSKELRAELAEKLDFACPALVREQRSRDGTKKFLWRLRDGETVESVLIKEGDRLTLCVSTQVGCPLHCSFCATGLSGFARNLSAGEIAGQLLAAEKQIGREINNVVYMGMGEPLLNVDSVLKSVRMLNDPKMRNLGRRHITISTSGVIPGIEELAASGLGVRLAVSLHAADDELRSLLMPVNQTYPASELRDAMQKYQAATGDRITIEYALFGGVNDGVERARELVRYLKGIHVFVNLIPANDVAGRCEKPKAEDVLRFRSVLESAGFECEIRSERGADIDAACGQLRRKAHGGEAAPEGGARTLAKAAVPPRVDKSDEWKEKSAARVKGAKKDFPALRANEKKKAFSPSGGFVAYPGKRVRAQRPAGEKSYGAPNFGEKRGGRGNARDFETPLGARSRDEHAELRRGGKTDEARQDHRTRREEENHFERGVAAKHGYAEARAEKFDTRRPRKSGSCAPEKDSSRQRPRGKAKNGAGRGAADADSAFWKFYLRPKKSARGKKP